MKRKVGILTVHKNTNYGANLQAFASCKYINDKGYDCKLVDYFSASASLIPWLKITWENSRNESFLRRIKILISLVLSIPWKAKRLRAFNKFRKKNTRLTKLCNQNYDIENLNLDAVVCGSDQIWNPDIMGGIIPKYFGDILGVKTKIAYAPSLGRDKYTDSDEVKVKDLIKKLDCVSVREEDSALYLQNLTGVEVKTVCDPVFLLDKTDYESVTSKRKIKGDYVLLYSVIGNEKLSSIAKDYADKKGLKLIEICSSKDKNAKHKQILTYGPSEFLSAFKYAKTVFTNSFHGTAFSLIFNKDFYVFNNKARGSRITNLLNKAGLTQRLISENVENAFEPINYKEVLSNLKPYVESSKEFLVNALSIEKRFLAGDKCVSCGACKNACHVDAIRLIQDREGFTTSVVDKSKCINCGLCEKVCPALNESDKNAVIKVFAFKGEDRIRENSTSGGAFASFGETVIKDGGVIYGASLQNDFTIKHVRVDKLEDIKLIQGTKYLPSDITNCYKDIESDLKSGKKVLFSGTPCLVDGVIRYLKLKKIALDNFISVDIICHGVPSPSVFKSYLKWLEKEHKSKVKNYYFRNKKISWRGSSCYAELENGKTLSNDKKLCGFMNLYYSNNITRNSCYTCQYAREERVSDLTVSDFWGIENLNEEFEDKLGVSMVMVNTLKGEKLFSLVSGEKITADLTVAKQPQLKAPAKKPSTRDSFWVEYHDNGVLKVLKKYGSVKEGFKTKIYNLKKKIFK